jgi:hypothetical protein
MLLTIIALVCFLAQVVAWMLLPASAPTPQPVEVEGPMGDPILA